MGTITPVLRHLFSWFENRTQEWSNRYDKKLTDVNTTLLMFEAILRERPGLQNIADHLQSVKWMQAWLELPSIHPSSLHRKLEELPVESLQELLYQAMAELAETYTDEHLARLGPLAAVDASTITIGAKRGEWAAVRSGNHAVKLHLCLGLVNAYTTPPLRTVLSTGVVSDCDDEVLRALVVPSVHTYIFDRGYVHYGHFVDWANSSVKFVARVRLNNRFSLVRERKCTGDIDKDAVVEITDTETGRKAQLRLVEYHFTDSRGKLQRVRVVTNRMDLSARDIARVYAWRWKIELFFRALKTQLNLCHVYNGKPRAIWAHIYLCLLVAVVCETIRSQIVPDRTLGYVVRILAHYLDMSMAKLLRVLRAKPVRTSKGRRKRGGRPRKHPKKLKHQRIIIL